MQEEGECRGTGEVFAAAYKGGKTQFVYYISEANQNLFSWPLKHQQRDPDVGAFESEAVPDFFFFFFEKPNLLDETWPSW